MGGADGGNGSHNPLHDQHDHPPDLDDASPFGAPHSSSHHAPPTNTTGAGFSSAASLTLPPMAPTVTGFGDFDDEDLSSSLQTASR